MKRNSIGIFVSIILTFFSLFIYLLSILSADYHINDWGLITWFSLGYFLSLLSLTIAFWLSFVSNPISLILNTVQILLLICLLWLTPILLGGLGASPSFSTGLDHFANAEFISRTGVINTSVSWYQFWPGVSIFGAVIVNVLGLTDFPFLVSIFPLIVEIISSIPLYLIFKKVLDIQDKRLVFIGIWFFYLCNWVSQDLFSSQALAYYLFIFILFFLIDGSYAQITESKVCVLIFFTSITITHLFTTLLIICTLSIFFLFHTRKFQYGIFALTVIIIAISWQILGCPDFFSQSQGQAVTQIFQWNLFISKTNIFTHVTSLESNQISHIQLTFVIIIFLLALIGFLFKKLFKDLANNKGIIITFLGIAIYIFCIGNAYGGELLHRFFLFVLPILIYFLLKIFKRESAKYFLLFVLVIFIPLSIFSRYGMANTNYVSKSRLNSVDFLVNNSSGGQILDVSDYEPVGIWKNEERYHYYYRSKFQSEDEILAEFDSYASPKFVPIGTVNKEIFHNVENDRISFNNFIESLDNELKYNKIFSSSDTNYVYENDAR